VSRALAVTEGLAVQLAGRNPDRGESLAREVRILLNDKEVFRGKPELRLATLAKTALAGDEELVFPASVELKP